MAKIINKLRVIGIDPGTATTGWAVLEEEMGKTRSIAFGQIATSKNDPEDARLWEISRDLEAIVKKYKPREAAIESLFFFKNQKTIIQVGQARGAILLTFRKNKVKISSYTPLQIKQALTGYGRAEKKQVQQMTKSLLGLETPPSPDDVADAIATALCHLQSRKINNLTI